MVRISSTPPMTARADSIASSRKRLAAAPSRRPGLRWRGSTRLRRRSGGCARRPLPGATSRPASPASTRRPHDRRRDGRRDAEIEDARHDVVGVQLVRLAPRRPAPGPRRASVRRRMLRARAIEQAAEDAGEDERDVHRVRVVGAAGGDDLGARLARRRRRDLRLRHGQREDDRIGRHRADHLRRHDVAGGEPDEDIGAVQHLGQRAAAAGRGSSPWRDRPWPSSCAPGGRCRSRRRGRRRRACARRPGAAGAPRRCRRRPRR